MKKIVAACVDRLLEFDSEKERTEYLRALDLENNNYEILFLSLELENGKFRLRIKQRYRNCKMFNEL